MQQYAGILGNLFSKLIAPASHVGYDFIIVLKQRRIMCGWHCWTYSMAIAYLYTYIMQLISTMVF